MLSFLKKVVQSCKKPFLFPVLIFIPVIIGVITGKAMAGGEKGRPQGPCPQAFAGFNAGGTVGYGIGTANVNENITVQDNLSGTVPFNRNPSMSLKGVDGGIIAGYLQRFGNWGAGVDFLANWTSVNKTETSTTGAPVFLAGSTGRQTSSVQVSLQNSLQLRGVFSYIVNNLVMPKIMLGWDISQYKLTDNFNAHYPNGGLPVSWSLITNGKKYINGFLWGAGVDFLVAQNVIFGLEYTGVLSQKVTFNAATSYNFPGAGSRGTINSAISLRPQYNSVKATLKYVF